MQHSGARAPHATEKRMIAWASIKADRTRYFDGLDFPATVTKVVQDVEHEYLYGSF